MGTGTPILFVHGAFSNGNIWRKVLPELSENFRCIVPNWPFGGHRTPITNFLDFTPIGIADLIAGFIDRLDVETVIIVANDTGGAYAQVFTANYPDKVSHLILSNCEGFEVFPPKKFKSLTTMVKVPGYVWLMAQLFRYRPSLKWDMAFGLLSHFLRKDELYELYVKHFSENKFVREDFKKLAVEWHPKYTQMASEKLIKFEKPVLILWGADDTLLFPVELGRRLMAIFPNSTFIEIENSKTFVQEDNPKSFVENIELFFK
ncbi:alpha/beta fold hydrolase [Costertonia aggregata]|uniref:Alpha/beta hydrolase n=1 Tax=Costertonia aggregata TaxID=343403 RepID=A0A7H9AT60_9FLAO|nr:alpha/beta hydrolase [Costertonia aggregata]QLG46532.1 alpha/beta hydrolase [Costertonia aggregata]